SSTSTFGTCCPRSTSLRSSCIGAMSRSARCRPPGSTWPKGFPVLGSSSYQAPIWRRCSGTQISCSRSSKAFLAEVVEEKRWRTEPDRVLATVLFTDIVSSTAKAAELGDMRWRELLEHHHTAIRRELSRFRGREIDTIGDGFFASFDGPARAIRCACAITDAVKELGLEVRAGLHTGECRLVHGNVTGIAV